MRLCFRNVYLCEKEESNLMTIVKDIELNFKIQDHEKVIIMRYRSLALLFEQPETENN